MTTLPQVPPTRIDFSPEDRAWITERISQVLETGRLTLDAFRRVIDDRTRMISTAWVTYGNGYRVDLPALGALCRERDIRLVVDGVTPMRSARSPRRSRFQARARWSTCRTSASPR